MAIGQIGGAAESAAAEEAANYAFSSFLRAFDPAGQAPALPWITLVLKRECYHRVQWSASSLLFALIDWRPVSDFGLASIAWADISSRRCQPMTRTGAFRSYFRSRTPEGSDQAMSECEHIASPKSYLSDIAI